MPFANQYGFVKAPGLLDRQVARTIAHELGHGAFGLKHTFDPEYGVSDNPQITRALNLMGYNDQTHLAKFQWDIIHQHSGETEFESTEEVMYADENNGQAVDTAVANQKVKDLIGILQQRIKEHLNNSTEKYPKLAYENESVLSSITEFDPNVGGGGQYRNGRLYIGTRNFKENSIDEDILATIYHEYMHYLNWQFGDQYRMENLIIGRVYSINLPCFEEKMQDEGEFLEYAYQLFFQTKMKYPDKEVYLDYPDFYEELNSTQKKEVDSYIQENNLEPEIKCFPFHYSPSNYFKDEINAHTETLNVNNKGMLKMSNEKMSFYYSEIDRYTKLYNKAITHEKK
jgi:hypothetical protein